MQSMIEIDLFLSAIGRTSWNCENRKWSVSSLGEILLYVYFSLGQVNLIRVLARANLCSPVASKEQPRPWSCLCTHMSFNSDIKEM